MSATFRLSRFLVRTALPPIAFILFSSACSENVPGESPDATGGVGLSGSGGTFGVGGGSSATGGGVGAGGVLATGGNGAGGLAPAAGGAGTSTGGAWGAGGGASTGGETGTGGQAPGAGGESAGAGGSPSGGGLADYNKDFKEFVGEDCELPEPMALSPADHHLPDPFRMADGSRLSKVSDWACQRAWLKKSVEAFVLGAKPGTPDTVTGSVSAMGVDVHVEHGGNSTDFSIPISLPSGTSGPVPAMFKAEGTGVPDMFIKNEGVATMSYNHSTAEGAYNQIYGGSGVSIQIKWAWAVSRAIDVMVSERDAGRNDIIDPTALGTTGCSYAGKSAFTVGAFDERIALGIPMESGTGGLGSYRVVGDMDLGPNGGENPEQVNEACDKNWLIGAVCSGNVDAVPADAHFLVAMYAPRGFTTIDNNRIGHLGPVAQYTADAAGAEVFKALGVEKHIGYHGGNDDDPHNHCTFYPSQEETARNAIRAFLTKSEAPANFMEPKLKNAQDQPVNYNLADYITWDTPQLN